MDILSIILIAIGLAMDCFAVSIGKGICARKFYWRYALRTALLFGFFQGFMPFVGYLISSLFAEQIAAVDHWVAFVLLGFLGGRMIVEGYKSEKDTCACEPPAPAKHYAWGHLLTLAIATSIDALATGVIFAPFKEWIVTAVLVIGAVSFLFALAGTFIGACFGKRFHLKVEVLGGIILILIGLKILVEHLFFA